MKKKSKPPATKKKTNLPAVNGVDNSPEQSRYYLTDVRKRDGKMFETWTLCDESRTAELRDNLNSKLEKLSPKLLFYLMHYKIVFLRMEQVNKAFDDKLDNFNFDNITWAFSKRDKKMVQVKTIPSSLHKRILYEAIEVSRHPWSLLNQLPDRFKEFRNLSETIIQKTDSKEINCEKLSEKQKMWIRDAQEGRWLGTIKDLFDHMVYGYVETVDQLSKYRVMNNWLQENHPRLHEFYLHGRGRYSQRRDHKVSPSIRERLKSLDKFVAIVDDLAICETAFVKQLKCLMDNDLLFTSVFYSYFYKPKRGKPPGLKKKAIERAKPYIYLLGELFDIPPIHHNGINIESRYDLGVLLLNALAGEEIYSVTAKKKSYLRGGGKFSGSRILYNELKSIRQSWRDMDERSTVK